MARAPESLCLWLSALLICTLVGGCDSSEPRVRENRASPTDKASSTEERKATPENVEALVGKRVTITLTFGGDPVAGRVVSPPEWDGLRNDYLFGFHRDDMQQPGKLRLSDVKSIRSTK